MQTKGPDQQLRFWIGSSEILSFPALLSHSRTLVWDIILTPRLVLLCMRANALLSLQVLDRDHVNLCISTLF